LNIHKKGQFCFLYECALFPRPAAVNGKCIFGNAFLHSHQSLKTCSMNTTKAKAIRDVLIHLFLIGCLLVGLFLAFFLVYLPRTTHHGEAVAVPDIKGKTLDEAQDFLSRYNLEYEVSDSTYVPEAKPLTVLSQFPDSGTRVKEDRKIFLTVAAYNPPEVEMPDLVNLSLRNAETLLKSVGLQLGELTKEPAFNTNVIRQEYQGKPVTKKTRLPKGSKVDLVLGDGVGPVEFEIPIIVGKLREDAEILLRGQGLRLKTRYDYNSKEPEGTIIKQEPDSNNGGMIRRGATMTIWVAARKAPQTDSAAADATSVGP